MSRPITTSRIVVLGLVAAVCGLAPSAIFGTTYTWDAISGNGVVDDGSGTWSTTNTNWTSDSGATDVAWTGSSTDIAAFGISTSTAGGTVTVSGSFAAGGIQFNGTGGTASYTIDGTLSPTLTLGVSGITVSSGAGTDAITSNVALTLSGAQSWTNNSTTNTLSIAAATNKGGNVLTISGAGNINMTGALTGTGGLYVDSSGTFNYSGTGGTTTDFRVGNGASGNFKISGGDLTVSGGGDIFMAQAGTISTLTQTGGTLNFGSSFFKGANNAAQTSNISVSAGTWNETGVFMTNQRGAGTLTVSGTGNMTVGLLALGGWVGDTKTATANLDGGSLTASAVSEQVSGGGTQGSNSGTTSVFNFNGGTLIPSATNSTFMVNVDTINVRNGGAIIDTNGKGITIAKALTHSVVGGDNATDGGLTVKSTTGSGTLTLTGASTYTGSTTISSGTLQIGAGSTAGTIGAGAITNNATLTFSRSDTIDLVSTNTITGTGALTANAGAGTIGVRGSISQASVALASTFASSAQGLYGSSYASAINLFADVTTTGNQTYTGIVSIGRGVGSNPTTNLTTTAGGSVTLTGGVISGVSGFQSAGTLNVNTSAGNGAVSLGGATLSYGVGNLNINSGTAATTLTGGNYYYDFSVFSSDVALTGNTTFQPDARYVRGLQFKGSLTSANASTLTASLGGGAASTSGTGTSGLFFSPAGAATASVQIKGTSALSMNGAGSLVLSGNNTYSGGTNLSAGTLNINSTTALGATGGAFTITGGTIDNTSGAAITLANNNAENWNADFAFTGASDGTHDLNLGTGTATLNASRKVTANAGTLTVGTVATAGNTLTTAGAGNINISGGLTGSAGLTINSTGTVTYSGGTTSTLANFTLNNNSSAVTSTFTQSGGSITATGGNNFFSNATSASTAFWNMTAGTFQDNRTGANFYGGNTASDSTTYNWSGGTYSLADSTTGFLVAARGTSIMNISGTANVTLNKMVFGLWTGEASTNTVNLNGGTLTVGKMAEVTSSGLAVGSESAVTSIFNFNGGTLQPQATNNTDFMTFVDTVNVRNNGALINTNGFNITIAKALTHSNVGGDNATDGGLTKSGVGTLTLSAANTYTGATAINAGTLELATNGSLASASGISVTGTLLLSSTGSPTIANAISGNGIWNITPSSKSSFTFSGNNSSFAGTLNINNFARYGTSGGSLPSTSATINVASGGQYFVGGSNPINIAGNGWVDAAGPLGALRFTGTYSGNVTLTANAGVSTYRGTGTITGNIGGNYQFSYLSGISPAGDVLTLTPSAANTYGSTRVDNTGATNAPANIVLQAGNANAFSAGGLSLAGVSGGLAILQLNGNNFSFANLSSDNAFAQIQDGASAAAILAVGSDGTSTAYSGTLVNGSSGALGITKTGAGTLTISGANTYTGGTAIQNGILSVGSLNSVSGGSASSNLGAPTTIAAGTISLGAATTTGQLTYTGGGQSTDRVIDLPGTTGGGIIDSSGMGALTVTSNFTATGVGSKTLTLQGSYTGGANAINGAIVDNGSGNLTSLTKSGPGTWILGGANAYTGATTVSGGKLYLNGTNATASIGVSGGATLGGLGSASSATATVSDTGGIEAGSGGAGSLTLAGLTFSNTGTIAIANLTNYLSNAGIVTGAGGLTASGGANSVTINLSGSVPSGSNTFHLLQYSSTIQGTGFTAFKLGTLPSGLGGRSLPSLVNDTGATNYIDLVVNVDYPVWSGAGDGTWSTATQTPKNWTLASNSSTTTDYIAGDSVLFSDSATGTTTVQINSADVSPSLTTFNFGSTISNYTLQGTDAIAGTGPFVKSGTGTLTISNANTYTGGTTLNRGTLNINNAAALGATASTFTIAGASTIDNTSGAAITLANNNPMNWNADFTFTGASDGSHDLNLGTGAVTLGSSRTLTVSAGNLTVGGGISDSTLGYSLTKAGAGSLILSGASTYSGGTTINGGTLRIGVANALLSTGAVNVNDPSAILDLGGFTTPAAGAVSLTAGTIQNGKLTGASYAVQSGSISAALAGGGALTKSTGGTVTLSGANIYTGATSVTGGALQLNTGGTLGNSNVVVGNGAFNLNGGSVTSNAGFRVGNLNGDVSVANISSGTMAFTAADWMLGSNNGNTNTVTWNQTGGTVTANTANSPYIGTQAGAGSSTLFSISGGSFSTNNEIWLGLRSNATLTISGTGSVTAGRLRMDLNAGVTGTVNLNGGMLTISDAYRVNGVGTFNLNFNGGTLRAAVPTANFIGGFNNDTVTTGGAVIDTQTFAVTIGQSLVHDSSLGTNPDGGLTKNGSGGTLTLSVAETYTGQTTVNAGLLTVNGSLNSASAVTVNDTAALSGTGAVNGPVSLAGGATGDAIGSTGTLTLAGTLGVSGSNNLFSSGIVSVAGTTTINDGGTFRVNGMLQGAGVVNLAAATTNSTLSGTGTISKAVALAGNDTLTSTGTLTLSSLNGVSISGTGNQLGGGIVSVAGAVTINDGATLAVNGTLSGAGAVNLSAATVNSTLSGTGAVNTPVTLAGNNTLSSTSTLTLGSTLTVGGAGNAIPSGSTINVASLTTISSGGSLRVNGTLGGAGTTTVSGTLRGTGTVSQVVTVNSMGTVAPGQTNNVPTVTASTLTLGSGSSLSGSALLDLIAGTGGADQIAFANGAANSATLGGTLTVTNPNGFTFAAGQSYDLFNFNSNAESGNFSTVNLPSLGTSTLAWNTASLYTTGFISVVSAGPPLGSGTWTNGAGGQTWTNANNWMTGQPSGATYVATFDATGYTATNPNPVLLGMAGQIVGGLVFNTAASTGYTIGGGGSDGPLTLNNNGSSAATITVNGGDQIVAASVVVAEITGATLSAVGGASLSITGTVNNGGYAMSVSGAGNTTLSGALSGSGSLTMSGTGMLTLGHSNSGYSGLTTVSSGTLRTGANVDNALGTGPLVANSTVNLNGNENIGTLSGSGNVSVASGKTLTVTQGIDEALNGSLTLGTTGNGATLALSATNTKKLTLSGSTALNTGNAIAVNGGTLNFNLGNTSTPIVGANVTAMVASGATLELTGTVSALADPTALSSGTDTHPAQRVAIQNEGALEVDGGTTMTQATQQVGGIDGAGSVTVADYSSLTADHINQTSLVIGNGSVFTLAPSDSNGNPMASGLVLAGSLAPANSFLASSGSLLGAGSANSTPAVSLGGGVSGASISAVPEPSTILLVLLGAMAIVPVLTQRRRETLVQNIIA